MSLQSFPAVPLLDDEVLELMIFKKYKVQVPTSLSSKVMDATEEKLPDFENYHFISFSWFGCSLPKTKTNSSSKIRDGKLFENCLSCCGHNATSKDVNSCA